MKKLLFTSCGIIMFALVMTGCNTRQDTPTIDPDNTEVMEQTSELDYESDPNDIGSTDIDSLESDLNTMELEDETFEE